MEPLADVYITDTKLWLDTTSSGTRPPQCLPSDMEIPSSSSASSTAELEQLVLFLRSKELK